MGALAFCAVVILTMFARSASIARARRIARPNARSHFSGRSAGRGVPPSRGVGSQSARDRPRRDTSSRAGGALRNVARIGL